RTHCALGRHGMFGGKLSAGGYQAAKVIRPWFVRSCVDQYPTDFPFSNLQRARRAAHECIDLAFLKETRMFRTGMNLPFDISLRIEAHIGGKHGDEDLIVLPKLKYSSCLALQLAR